MNMYGVFLWVTGFFSSEWIHGLTLRLLGVMPGFCFKTPKETPIKAMGVVFKHPVGLAAGFDKDGRYLKAFSKLGLSSVELGTVTPKPQSGNPKPRLFRVPQLHALINRMGFNNEGVDALVERIKKSTFDGVLGISIGPNKETLERRVWLDYEYCLKQVYLYADYIAINISSPNTPGLRALHHKTAFSELIRALVHARGALIAEHDRYVPIVVKVSPDESDEAIQGMAITLVSAGLDGMILTNTTLSREGLQQLPVSRELGGLSGRPLAKRAIQCLRLVKEVVGDNLVLIASGGIDSPEEAVARINAGASFVQLYSGLVYQGPRLVADIANAYSSLN